MKLLCGTLQAPPGFNHHLNHVIWGVFSPCLGEAFLNFSLMAFTVQLPLSELSCHLIGKNRFSKAIKTKGSSVKEEENKYQVKKLESRGSGGRAGIVAPQEPYGCAGWEHLPQGAALRCSWRSTSYLPPLSAPDEHDVRLLAQLGIWTPSPLMAAHAWCLFTQP